MDLSKFSIERRLDKLAGRILVFGGENPVIFLDTGAVIDFEKEMARWRLKDKRVSPDFFYKELQNRTGKIPFFVTELTQNEILKHYKFHSVNGNHEISPETFEITTAMHGDYCGHLRNVIHNFREIEQVRYDTYWAGHMAFDKNHKKSLIDPISLEDRALIASALWTRYTSVPGKMRVEVPISGSIIISPDEHISEVTRVLNSDKFNYNGLEVVSSR